MIGSYSSDDVIVLQWQLVDTLIEVEATKEA